MNRFTRRPSDLDRDAVSLLAVLARVDLDRSPDLDPIDPYERTT